MKRNLGLAIVAALALGCIVIECLRPSTTGGSVSFEIERARLAKCLVGHPVDAMTPLDDELRRIELGARVARVADWPRRCAPYAEALESAKNAARASAARLSLATHLGPETLYEHLHVATEIIDALRPDRDAAPIEWERATAGVEPPPAALALPDGASTLPPGLAEPGGVADLVLRSHAQGVTCRFAAANGGLEPIARCRYDADAITGEPRLRSPVPSTTDGKTYLRDRSTGEVREAATGELLIKGDDLAIHVDAAGHVAPVHVVYD